jgi:hypothetical protein
MNYPVARQALLTLRLMDDRQPLKKMMAAATQ